MFTKQIPNGKLLPKKIWHLPSLSDELYSGHISSTQKILKRKLVIESARQPETPRFGEISRIKCTIYDRENDENVAEGFQITNQNNKKFFEITQWNILTNSQYIIHFTKTIYDTDPEKSKNEYNALFTKWNILDPDFEKDIVSSILKDKNMVKAILSSLETHIVPLFGKASGFDDETKFDRFVMDTLAQLGYQYNQFDGFENPMFKQAWEEYGLNEQGQVIQTQEWNKTFAGIFLNLKQQIHHKRIKERPAGGVSDLHMTKWGTMSESENNWED